MASNLQERIANALADLNRQERAISEVKDNAAARQVAAEDAFERASRLATTVSAMVDRDVVAIKQRRADLALLMTATHIAPEEESEMEEVLAPLETETRLRADKGKAPAPSSSTPVGASTGRKRARSPSPRFPKLPVEKDEEYDDNQEEEFQLIAPSAASMNQARKVRRDPTTMTNEEIDEHLAELSKYSQLPNCSIIIKNADGDWVELQCDDCKGNFSTQTNSLLRGVGAFATHLVKSHRYPKMGYDQCIVYSTLRTVPQGELRAIYREGEKAVKRIIKFSDMETTVPTSRRSVQKKENVYTDEWRFVRNPKNFLSNCSCILKHPDGHWVEIQCPVCKGNWSSFTNSYLKNGLKGYWDHIHHAHEEPRMAGGPCAIIERCWVRDLSDEDVAALRRRDGSRRFPHPGPIYSTKGKDGEEAQDGAKEGEETQTGEETAEKDGEQGAEKAGEEEGAQDETMADIIDLTGPSPERPYKKRHVMLASAVDAEGNADAVTVKQEPGTEKGEQGGGWSFDSL